MKFSKKVKRKLNQLIEEMAQNPDPYVQNPGRDFSRNRKLGFVETMKLTISMEAGTLKKELLEFFHYDTKTVSASAYVQQRRKLKNHAFYTILNQLNNSFSGTDYHGFNLIACDGTVLNIPLDTGNDQYKYFTKAGQSSYYQLSITALYDLCKRRYLDAEMLPRLEMNERKALHTMIDRGQFNKKTIFIMDRGYEEYDLPAHIDQQNMFYVMRAKDSNLGGLVKGFKLAKEGEYDKTITRIFTCLHNKTVENNPEIYQRVRCKRSKYFINRERPYYEMTMRILRIKLREDTYECIITNLPEDQFSAEEVKRLYKMRWGIETSFRELKYAIGLTYLHSKKVEFIEQEILARLILYNFCEIITTHVMVSQKPTKYVYQLNYTMAIHICRHFLRYSFEKAPPDVETLIAKQLLPVRPERNCPRTKIYRAPVKFVYRVL